MPRRRSKKKKKLYLRSSDGELMEAEESLIAESGIIRSHLTINSHSNANVLVDLDNVDSATLSLVIEYCRNRPGPVIRDRFTLQQILNAHDNEFITNRVNTRETLLNLKIAAQKLKIQSLLNLTLRRIRELDFDKERIDRNLERRRESVDWAPIILAVFVILITFILATFFDAIHYR